MNHIEDLYENRLLVFLEDQDNNVFRQVLLTPEQFKKVGDAIVVEKPADEQHDLRQGYEVIEITLDEAREIPADLFIGMSSTVLK